MKARVGQFTLTEFLVAIALSLGIFSILGFSLSSNIKVWNDGRARLKLINELVSLDGVIKPIFNGAKAFKISEEQKKSELLFDGTQNELFLVYQHRLNNYADGVLRFIKLYYRDGKLFARYYNRYENYRDDKDSLESILIDNIKGVSFFYAAEEKLNSLKVQWYDIWQKKKYLPLAIRMQIHFNDNKTENFLWRVSNSSLYQRFGNFAAEGN